MGLKALTTKNIFSHLASIIVRLVSHTPQNALSLSLIKLTFFNFKRFIALQYIMSISIIRLHGFWLAFDGTVNL
jgi:hypothetical protein